MRRYLRPEVLAGVARFRAVADATGCTPAQLAIAWCLRRPEVTSAILGATTERHVEEGAAAAAIDLAPEVVEAVDRALAGASAPPV
jgi:aryl-alcohol dehydrogenase-like predicted oxidoreductase